MCERNKINIFFIAQVEIRPGKHSFAVFCKLTYLEDAFTDYFFSFCRLYRK